MAVTKWRVELMVEPQTATTLYVAERPFSTGLLACPPERTAAPRALLVGIPHAAALYALVKKCQLLGVSTTVLAPSSSSSCPRTVRVGNPERWPHSSITPSGQLSVALSAEWPVCSEDGVIVKYVPTVLCIVPCTYVVRVRYMLCMCGCERHCVSAVKVTAG